mmetsp:Transcript_28948/g.46533  ORF Transcript_28948/g.46533 Transcript_28948/m.46533 type:complete len:1427 (-) Transcript_28948:7463-11743(-)
MENGAATTEADAGLEKWLADKHAEFEATRRVATATPPAKPLVQCWRQPDPVVRAVALQARLAIAEDFPSLMSVDSQGSLEQRQRNEASMASSSKKSKGGGWNVARRDADVCVTLQCESTMAEKICKQNQAATKQAPSISETSAGGKPLMKDAAALDVISDIVVSTTDESSTCSTCNTKRPKGSFSGNRLAAKTKKSSCSECMSTQMSPTMQGQVEGDKPRTELLAHETHKGCNDSANAVQEGAKAGASEIAAPILAEPLVADGGAENAAAAPVGGKKARKKKKGQIVLDTEVAAAKKQEEAITMVIPKDVGDEKKVSVTETSVTGKAERKKKEQKETVEIMTALSSKKKTPAVAVAVTETQVTGTMRHVCQSASCRVLLPRSSLGEALECCPACGHAFSEAFVRCQKEATLPFSSHVSFFSISTALEQHGLHILLPKNAEALLPFDSNLERIGETQFVHDDDGASSYLLRHIIQSQHLTTALVGHIQTAQQQEKEMYMANRNTEEEAKGKANANDLKSSPSSVGCWVKAKESFMSDSEDRTEVPRNLQGTVREIDKDGDVSIDFEGLGSQWVFKSQFCKISVLSRQELNLTLKVAMWKHLEHFEGAGLYDWQNMLMLHVSKAMTLNQLKKQILEAAEVEEKDLRIWPCCKRKNETIRTQSFLNVSGDTALKDIKGFHNPHNDIAIMIFVELKKPEEKASDKFDDADSSSLIFFKYWDPKQKSLRHIGHHIFSPTTRVKVMVEEACSKFLPHLQLDDIEAFEELKQDKIDNLVYTVEDSDGIERDACLEDTQVELQSGDIIVFQPAGLEGTEHCVRQHYHYLHGKVLAPNGVSKREEVQQMGSELEISRTIVNFQEQGDIAGILNEMRISIQHASVQSAACKALGNLALLGDDSDAHMIRIGLLGGIDCIFKAMDTHTTDCKTQRHALDALVSLTFDSDNEDKFRSSFWPCVHRVVRAMALDETDLKMQTDGKELLSMLQEEQAEETKMAPKNVLKALSVKADAAGEYDMKAELLQAISRMEASPIDYSHFQSIVIFLEWMCSEGVALILRGQLQVDALAPPNAIRLIESAFHSLYGLVSRDERFGQYRKVSSVKISGVKAGKTGDTVNGTYFPVEMDMCGGKVTYMKEGTDAWIEYHAAKKEWQVKPKTSRGTGSAWMGSVSKCAETETVEETTGGWKAYNGTSKLWEVQKGATVERAEVGKDYYHNMIDTMLEMFVCAVPEWVSSSKVEEHIEILRQLMASAKSYELSPSHLTFSPKLTANFSQRQDSMKKEWNILGMAISSNIPQLTKFVLDSMPNLTMSLDNAAVISNSSYPPLHFACTQRVAVEKMTFTDSLRLNFSSPSSVEVVKICVLAGLVFKIQLGFGNRRTLENGYLEGLNEPVLHIELTNAGALIDNTTVTVEINLINMTKKTQNRFYCAGNFLGC